MIAHYTVKTNVGFGGDSPIAYGGEASASCAFRYSTRSQCQEEGYSFYGLLHIPKKDIVVLLQWIYIGRFRIKKCRVFSEVDKVNELFSKLEGCFVDRREVKVNSLAIYWFEKYLAEKVGMDEVLRLASQYFSVERRS